MTSSEMLRTEWKAMTRTQKETFCITLDVTPMQRDATSYSPRHPFTGRPDRESYRTALAAAVAQVDWFVSLI